MIDEKIQATAEVAGENMDEILALFKPGARIALAVWYPGKPELDFVLVHPQAKIDDAIAALKRRRDATDSLYGRTWTV